MNYNTIVFKRKLEAVIIQPFVWIGRLCAWASWSGKEYSNIYFFPFYHIGGAEKLHFQIAHATGGESSLIYFTRKSNSEFFLEEFRRSGCEISDISKFTDNKYFYFVNLIMRGVISFRINRQKKQPLVFNGQSNFGYKVSPWINRNIPQVELIHALNTFSKIRLPFIQFYRTSVTVSQEIIDRHRLLYSGQKVPGWAWEKFVYVASKVRLPESKKYRDDSMAEPLVVLYVGRATNEKRPWLVSNIARQLAPSGLYRFEFAGDVSSRIPGIDKPFCHFHGDVRDEQKLNELYTTAHVLLIPSSSESGPLVFMEAMARGAIIISTPVGLINLHVKNGVTGFVTMAVDDDAKVTQQLREYLTAISNQRAQLKAISDYGVDYAFQHFDLNELNDEYRSLFNQIRQAI